MIPLRVSTTDLESYRRAVEHPEWVGTESDLIASIMGKPFAPSWQAQAGSAWHACLERPGRHYVGTGDGPDKGDYFRAGNYTFNADDVEASLAFLNYGGAGAREVKAVKTYQLAGQEVNLVAKADWIRGLAIQDAKVKFSAVDLSLYETSLQWKAYLAVHEAAAFRYVLFPMKEPKVPGDRDAPPTAGHCVLKGPPVAFTLWRYPGMENDVRSWLGEFLAWAERRKLLNYLKREGTA